MEQYIGFYLDQNEYMIPVLNVREIINMPPITRIPLAPAYIEGVTNLRGVVVPLVNLKKLMGLKGMEKNEAVGYELGNKVIIITHGGMLFGVVVDKVSGIISVEESSIEATESVFHSSLEQAEGIVKLKDRVAVLLDTKRLLPEGELEVFEDLLVSFKEREDGKVELTKKVQTMGREITVKELKDARDFFEKRKADSGDPRYMVLDDIVDFINALAECDYDRADKVIQNMIKKGQDELFSEIGKITRKLHDTIKSFKQAIDPKIKEVAMREIPSTIESLEFVIEKSEEAANKTMSIVEKYILGMDDLDTHIKRLSGPEVSVEYLKNFKNNLEDDLIEVLTTQSFQDITGQLIKKVIKLIGDIEEELVRLIKNFGERVEVGYRTEATSQKITQADVDELLREFGF
ncbi:MAG: chemotaxis protein CheZ [Deltaproteobacteria bacterium]|nr:MAG: chemotaxis protein CheZ [Deltaproteobacteria bacterium]